MYSYHLYVCRMSVPVSTRYFIMCQCCVTEHTIVICHFPRYDMMHEERLTKYHILSHHQYITLTT